MSISSNFPNVRPSLLLDFANTQALDPRVTFSRSTIAPYYDGKTSVLAEQNLLKNSQIFTSIWAIPNTTVTANSIVAPDGTTTGSTLTDSAVTNNFQVQQSLTGSAGAYTGSMYFQAGTIGFAYVQVTDGTFRYTVLINLATGAFANSSSTGSPTGTAYTITQSGSWWRLAVTVNLTGSTVYMVGGLSNSATPTFTFGNAVYTGTGTGTIYVWGAQLEQRSSATAYNATTTTAITNYIPQLLTAPINSPRFDYNPTTGESLGLLIEQSSTNLLTYSQDFTNAVWTKGNATITATANIAPDGTQTASKLVENTSTALHQVYETISHTTTAYTLTVYAKKAERAWINLCLSQGSAFGAMFDLTNGVTGFIDTGTTATITPVGNGWYRCSITFTTTTGSCSSVVRIAKGNATSISDANINYLGDGFSGAYIWQMQDENLSFATSPIPTTSAQVTRASDLASIPTTGWYSLSQGTWYSNSNRALSLATQHIIQGNNAFYQHYYHISGGAGTYDGSTLIVTPSLAVNSFHKIATTYGSSGMAITADGATPVTTASYNNAFASNTLFYIGSTASGVNYLNGHIKNLSYYSQAVTSTNLQALTGS